MSLNLNLKRALDDLFEPKNEAALLKALSDPNSPIFNKLEAERLLRQQNHALSLEYRELLECLLNCIEENQERYEIREQLESFHRHVIEQFNEDIDSEEELSVEIQLNEENSELFEAEPIEAQQVRELEEKVAKVEAHEEIFEESWERMQHQQGEELAQEAEKQGLFTSETQQSAFREMVSEQPSPLRILQANPELLSKPDVAANLCARGGIKNELALHCCCGEGESPAMAILESMRRNKKKVSAIMNKIPGAAVIEKVGEALSLCHAKKEAEEALRECQCPRSSFQR